MLKVNLPLFTINDKEILKNINFEVRKNLTILGSNGAGKSTLAKLMCGLLKSKNSIKIDDFFIEEMSFDNRKKAINYIPPKLSIYDSYIKVYDFLELGENRRDTKEVLKLLELEEFQDSFCSNLSSGEQQLLLLASALTHGANITIFDEPTSNLDPQKTKRVFKILKSSTLLDKKIVITHDLQLASKLEFPILYISHGRAKMYESSQHFFTPSNLKNIFGDSVIKNGEDVVMRL